MDNGIDWFFNFLYVYAVGVVPTRRQPQSGRISALAGRRAAYERVLNN
ncbi:replication protein RepA4 [Klebsiella pneumoniae subsp. pneumoniae]|nr:replication protein RepA4 [Klebsiella pneumoniae subsp. pneumoniae]RNW87178.1 replication protein RepA4 [Klebsiella pneumoniae subsp. pneumoniae]